MKKNQYSSKLDFLVDR